MKGYCLRVKNRNGKYPPAGYFKRTSSPSLEHFVQTIVIKILTNVNIFCTSCRKLNSIKTLYQLYAFFMLLKTPETDIEEMFLLHIVKIT